jgi:DMSO reductase family type II enzyme chaperone
MSELNYQSTGNGHSNDNTPERGVNDARDAGGNAPGRCLMYAVFSDIAASPFDAEPAVAGEAFDVAALQLPYELSNIEGLLQEWRDTDKEVLKREYSGLFEVGSNGPPVPIREDLHLNQPAGVREDIVRFYEYFGYGLEENFAWSPDHLSIELEFMHFLCFQEAEMSMKEGGDALSFQLAQSDFSERHLVNWVSGLAAKIIEQQPDGLYGRLIAAMSEFLVKDFEWQARTIVAA